MHHTSLFGISTIITHRKYTSYTCRLEFIHLYITYKNTSMYKKQFRPPFATIIRNTEQFIGKIIQTQSMCKST